MYIGEYGESDIDSNPIVYLRDADGINSVFYGDFEFWMPRPPMPEVE